MASVTETSRSGGAYVDYNESSLPTKSTHPTGHITHKPSNPSPHSHRSTPVPIPSSLPVTVPLDLIPPQSTWVNSTTQPSLIHPSSWTELNSTGPWPFTTLITYQLPSGHQLTWEARRQRRQIEQHFLTVPSDVEEKRRALRRPWYSRIHLVHLKRWSWWAVLWFNVGSHALIYAAVCLFIPYFNSDSTIYEANTGWSSNVLAAVFWLLGNVFEMMAIWTSRPASKWYQLPRPLLPSHQRRVDPRTYDVAYVDDPTPPVRFFGLLHRVDLWIPALRLIAVLAFLIETVSYSGAFDLTDQHRKNLVFTTGFISSCLFILTSYVSLAECCHRWLPLKLSTYPSYTFLDWWINVLNLLASFALLAYFIDLWYQPELLDQRQGPAIPYLIMSVLFTASDWLQAVEQGEEYYYEKRQVEVGPGPVVQAPPLPPRPVVQVEESEGEGEHRMDVRSPRVQGLMGQPVPV